MECSWDFLCLKVLNSWFYLFTLNWFLYMVWGRDTASSFCMWLSSCASNNYFKNYYLTTECSWKFCWKTIEHKCKILFLDPEFYNIYLYTLSYTILFHVIFPVVSLGITINMLIDNNLVHINTISILHRVCLYIYIHIYIYPFSPPLFYYCHIIISLPINTNV